MLTAHKDPTPQEAENPTLRLGRLEPWTLLPTLPSHSQMCYALGALFPLHLYILYIYSNKAMLGHPLPICPPFSLFYFYFFILSEVLWVLGTER